MDRALESVELAAGLDPNGADAKLNLAIVLTYAGRHPEALAAIERVLQLDPRPKPQVFDYYGLVLYMNRQYDKALQAVLSPGPRDLGYIGLETLAMASARSGRTADARRAVETILTRMPDQNVASLRVLYGHHQHQDDLDLRLSALREAGLPEWCFDFRGRPEDRLDSVAIRNLAASKSWIGHHQNGMSFYMQLEPNGDFAQRAQAGMAAGRLRSRTTSSARNLKRSCSAENFAVRYTVIAPGAPKRTMSMCIWTRAQFVIFRSLSDDRDGAL